MFFRNWSKSLAHVHFVSLFFYLLPYYLWLAVRPFPFRTSDGRRAI
jgi:hypothetical protein